MKVKIKPKVTLKNKLICVLSGMNIISLALVSILVYTNLSIQTKQDFIKDIKTQVNHVDTIIGDYTKSIEENTNMLSTSSIIKNIDSRITSYIDKKGNNGQVEMNPLKNGGYEAEVYTYFENFVKTHPGVMSAAVGVEENGGYLQYPAKSRKEGYDSRERSWYKLPIKNPDKICFSDAYVASCGDISVLCLTALKDSNNKIKGVLNVGISLNKITELVKNEKIGENGYIVLVDKNGTILADGKDSEMISKNIKELKIEKLNDLEKVLGSSFEINLEGGKKYLVLVEKSKNENLGWTYISFIETSEFNKIANKIGVTILIFASICIIIGIILSVIIANKTSKPIISLSNHLKLLGKGEFTGNIDSKYTSIQDEIGEIAKSTENMQKSIKNMLLIVKHNSTNIDQQAEILHNSSQQIASSTSQVSSAIQDVAKGSSNQSNDLAEITNILSKFGKEIEQITESISEVEVNSKTVASMANASDNKMENLLKSVDSVDDNFKEFTNKIVDFDNSVTKINEITNLINNIAGQTNLLALNASIEAARAGELGKGFAVVADEIRNLAEQSKESSEQIARLVSNISNDTKSIVSASSHMSNQMKGQVEDITSTVETFKGIIDVVDNIIPKIETINASSGNINKQKGEILNTVENISSISEEVSASSEEIVASVQEMEQSTDEVSNLAEILSNTTREMNSGVSKFKL